MTPSHCITRYPPCPSPRAAEGGDNECFHSLGYFESTRKLERETFLRSYHWNKICFKFRDDLDGKWDKDKSDTKYLLHFLLCTSLSISVLVLLFNVVCWDQNREKIAWSNSGHPHHDNTIQTDGEHKSNTNVGNWYLLFYWVLLHCLNISKNILLQNIGSTLQTSLRTRTSLYHF